MRRFLVFDTETTGLPVKGAAFDDPRQPQVVQFAAVLMQEDRTPIHSIDIIVRSPKEIPEAAARVHGITTEFSQKVGLFPSVVMGMWEQMARVADMAVAHNIDYDLPIIRAIFSKYKRAWIQPPEMYCTMKQMTNFCKLPARIGYKWPTLSEAYRHIFNKEIENAHNAMGDVSATTEIFFALLRGEVREKI